MKISNYHLHNIYALKKITPKMFFFDIIVIIFFFLCLIFCFIFFPTSISLTGIYESEGVITTFIPLSKSNYLTTDKTIVINDKQVSIQKLEFKEIINPDGGNEAYQNVKIYIPQQKYSAKQTINFDIEHDPKNLWCLFYEALKGGEI